MRRSRLCPLLASVIVLTTLAACDASTTGPGGTDVGEIHITGAVEKTFQIQDQYTQVGYDDGWTLGFLSGGTSSGGEWVQVNWACGGRLGTGTYEVLQDDEVSDELPAGTCIALMGHQLVGDSSERVFWSVSGELELTRMDVNNRITGHLDVQVRERTANERAWHPSDARARVQVGFQAILAGGSQPLIQTDGIIAATRP